MALRISTLTLAVAGAIGASAVARAQDDGPPQVANLQTVVVLARPYDGRLARASRCADGGQYQRDRSPEPDDRVGRVATVVRLPATHIVRRHRCHLVRAIAWTGAGSNPLADQRQAATSHGHTQQCRRDGPRMFPGRPVGHPAQCVRTYRGAAGWRCPAPYGTDAIDGLVNIILKHGVKHGSASVGRGMGPVDRAVYRLVALTAASASVPAGCALRPTTKARIRPTTPPSITCSAANYGECATGRSIYVACAGVW